MDEGLAACGDTPLPQEPTRRPFHGNELLAGSFGLVAVMLDVRLGRFCAVMRGMMKMTLRGMSVVRGRFVIPCLMVLGRFAMMPRRVLVMFRRFDMMLCRLLGHKFSLMRSGRTDAERLLGDHESSMTTQ